MKTKDQAFYQKLVMGGQWKKVSKVMSSGSQQEKEWILETMGVAAARSDEHYNQLVGMLQEAQDKPVILAAIRAMGHCARSSAVSQLEFLGNRTEDADVQEALTEARHMLKASIQ